MGKLAGTRVAVVLLLPLLAACAELWGFEEGTFFDGMGLGGFGGIAGAGAGGHAGAGARGGGTTTGLGASGGMGGGWGCLPGDILEFGDCANCGTVVRECDAEGDWSEPACVGEGVCVEGTTQQRDCARCGRETRTCNESCQWGAYGSCQNQGVCDAGSERDCMCSTYNTKTRCCGREICSTTCQWGGCGLKPGATCNWNAGTNWRCCPTTPGQWQFCLDTCTWSTACEACTGCNC